MRGWDTDIIISFGLVIMGIAAVIGWIWLSIKTGTSSGTEIPIGIISGLTGVLTGKKLAEAKQNQQNQMARTIEQIAEVGDKIVEANDAAKNTGKK